jgi:EpsI family protein
MKTSLLFFQNLPRSISFFGSLVSLSLVICLGGFSIFLSQKQEATFSIPLERIPYQIGSWRGEDTAALGYKEEQTLKLDSYIRRNYINPEGEVVFVYIGFWKQQTGDHQAAKHSPALCLPANGWNVFQREKFELTLTEGRSIIGNSLIGEQDRQMSRIWYWFYAGNDFYAEDWQAILRISMSNLIYGRSDGGIVEFAIPLSDYNSDYAQAQKTLNKFIDSFGPYLLQYTTEFKH